MQAYGSSFARVYNLRWTAFSTQVAPRIRTYYESTPFGRENQHMLDLCCGTGQLALHFLDHGYQVTGLD
ncbi:MAG: class I SAM-dependent methyltransferase, partial [Anaerolineaceae bacterium]|nr:class I SAM-dependent methyltransferase [Anaerolineaceae bacterium]